MKPPAQPGVAVQLFPDKQLVDEAFVWRGHVSLLLDVLEGLRSAEAPLPHDVRCHDGYGPGYAEGTVYENTAGLRHVLSRHGAATSSLIVSLCVETGPVLEAGSAQLMVDELTGVFEVAEDIVRASIVNEDSDSVLQIE